MKQNVKKIGIILDAFSKSIQHKVPLLQDGNLDVNKLQTLQETKDVINTLKKEGVKTTSELFNIGYPAAGLILKF